MAVVTTDERRGQARDVYIPPTERGMAHHSYLSPDGRWVIIVEMNSLTQIIPCRVVPFQGGEKPIEVGPSDGACTSAAWSPDSKWIYVTVEKGDRSHIYRQRFPGGRPEQITSGVTEEAGIAMAADGKSFITSVGTRSVMVWIHDQSGDHQISSEGDAENAQFSSDGKKLYYLYARGQSHLRELRVRNLADGKWERVLADYPTDDYKISKDGKQVAFSMPDQSGRSSLWIAPTNLRSSPRQIVSSSVEDAPLILPDGDLVFRATEGEENFLYRMHADGTDRRKLFPQRIFDVIGGSPDGRWIIVSADTSLEGQTAGTFAVPVEGGQPVLLCLTLCLLNWDIHGDYVLASLFGNQSLGTYVLPVRRSTGLPDFPAHGIAGTDDWKKMKHIAVLPYSIDSAASLSVYAYTKESTRRNLYRIPLP
jgi:Tol biopolymer transport system component